MGNCFIEKSLDCVVSSDSCSCWVSRVLPFLTIFYPWAASIFSANAAHSADFSFPVGRLCHKTALSILLTLNHTSRQQEAPGTPSWNVINPGLGQTLLPVCPMKSTPLVKGDEFLHIQAGAGGFGDPMERSADKVLDDVRNELITIDYAADVYGVVIEAGEVNYPATELQRHPLAASKSYKTAYMTHFYQSVGIPPIS